VGSQDGVVAGQVSAVAALTARVTALENAGESEIPMQSLALTAPMLADGVSYGRTTTDYATKWGYITQIETYLNYSDSMPSNTYVNLLQLPAEFGPTKLLVGQAYKGGFSAPNLLQYTIYIGGRIACVQNTGTTWTAPVSGIRLNFFYMSSTFSARDQT
jgi:hypothetical protein